MKDITQEVEEELERAAQLVRDAERGKGTMARRTTLGHLMISIGMALPQGDTTQSTTHGALLVRTDSGTGHGRSMRKLAGSGTKENKSTTV
jgi:hypothetical protein